MSEKKQLNEEQLEKINGGAACTQNESELTWSYALNKEVTLYNFGSGYYNGVIKKKGKLLVLGYYMTIYYVEFPANPEKDGWFKDDAIRYAKSYYDVDKSYYPSIVVVEE